MEKSECKEWQSKYDPRKIRLGFVSDEDFVSFDNTKYFDTLQKRVELFEFHMGEKMPPDFRKYLLYCGLNFFNWCMLSIHFWELDGKTSHCIWCKQQLAGTKCTCKMFDGTDTENDKAPGLLRFSHEGCGHFMFIVVAGPLKGSIWNSNNNGSYLTKSHMSFKEVLEMIYGK